MANLSGGQKALVSLAFIFALQKVDPTPFYIFDEVDCSLDETYRSAIASKYIYNFIMLTLLYIDIIQRIASNDGDPKQFIITSFRPQLCQFSDKFFKVTNNRGVSTTYNFIIINILILYYYFSI